MYTQFEEFQKIGKTNFDAAVANLGNTAKNIQVLATETTDYSKSAYENFVAYSTKVGEVFSAIAKDTVKPFEAAVAKVSK